MLDCSSDFSASVDIGKGQVLMRASLASTLDFTPPDEIPSTVWAVILNIGDTRLKTFVIKESGHDKSLAVENILVDKDTRISAKIAAVDWESLEEDKVPIETVKKAFGPLAPLAVIFEVC